MTLKCRLQQIEAASDQGGGYQPITGIRRTIVDFQQRRCEWLVKGVGINPETRAKHQAEAVSRFVAKSGMPESAFNAV